MIVIGGSTGSFASVQEILQRLVPKLSVPIVIAVHRRPDDEDLLTPLLQRVSALEVCEVVDKMPPAPGKIYVGPADYHVLIEREYLSLSVDERINYARPSIDVLFESAALTHRNALIGVVLTGSGSDGARGAAAIEEYGGRVLIEDPVSAQRPEMPAAALAATRGATVSTPVEIAARLNLLGMRAERV
jgi:two-component system chemotaxis response regulator CheB